MNRRSEGVDEPEKLAEDEIQTLGAVTDPEYDLPPDVAVDGTIEQEIETEPSLTVMEPSFGPLRSVYYTFRGLIRAPISLLRRYLIPILAFATVFGVVLWFLF